MRARRMVVVVQSSSWPIGLSSTFCSCDLATSSVLNVLVCIVEPFRSVTLRVRAAVAFYVCGRLNFEGQAWS